MEEDGDPIAAFSQELDSLVINSKPQITMLMMLADDYKEVKAAEIVDVIERRILQVKVDKKLPTLYLIDSICKNLSNSSYVQLFQQKIERIFCHTFERSNDKTRLLLHKLRQTWVDIFDPEVLYKLDVSVNELDPGWPVLGRKTNRTVPQPSSSSSISKVTKQVSTSQSRVASTLPTSFPKELIDRQLQGLKNEQRELLITNVKASSSEEAFSAITDNNKQKTNIHSSINNHKGRKSDVNNTVKRRIASPEDHQNGNLLAGKRRKQNTLLDPQSINTSNNKIGQKSDAAPRRLPQQSNRGGKTEITRTAQHLQTSTSTTSNTVGPIVEPNGSVALFINGELARLYYLDNVTAVVVKAHPDTPFDQLITWTLNVLEPKQVFFAGPTTLVYVDEGTPQAQTLCLEFGAPQSAFFIGSHNQQTIQLGLPARELILNGSAYTIAFGGEAISVFLDGAYHTFRLSDSRPHLQFSDNLRYDLWTRLVEDARAKAGFPPLTVPYPNVVPPVATPVSVQPNFMPTLEVKAEAPVGQVEPPIAPPDLNSLLSKLTAAGLISNPPPTSSAPAEQVMPQLPLPTVPSSSSSSFMALPPPPTMHHPNGAKKTKRERQMDRQRHSTLVHQQAQQQKQKRKEQRAHKPLVPKKYLPLESASLKGVHPFAVDQLYSGTPCTNCSLRFGEEALRAEDGKKSRYARHLDWHFRQNRRLKAKPTGVVSGGTSAAEKTTSTPSIITTQRRAWYYPIDLWILYKEVNDDLEEEAAAAAAFFDQAASAVASTVGNSASTTSSTVALLATVATFDWARFKDSIDNFEAFMEVINHNSRHSAADPNDSGAEKACKKCTVVADSAFTEITCSLCQEVLEQKWAEEEEEWRGENAVRYQEIAEGEEDANSAAVGRIYHPLCLKDYLIQKEKQQQKQEEVDQIEENAEEDLEEENEEEASMEENSMEDFRQPCHLQTITTLVVRRSPRSVASCESFES